jgi:hypothetical protein
MSMHTYVSLAEEAQHAHAKEIFLLAVKSLLVYFYYCDNWPDCGAN